MPIGAITYVGAIIYRDYPLDVRGQHPYIEC